MNVRGNEIGFTEEFPPTRAAALEEGAGRGLTPYHHGDLPGMEVFCKKKNF